MVLRMLSSFVTTSRSLPFLAWKSIRHRRGRAGDTDLSPSPGRTQGQYSSALHSLQEKSRLYRNLRDAVSRGSTEARAAPRWQEQGESERTRYLAATPSWFGAEQFWDHVAPGRSWSGRASGIQDTARDRAARGVGPWLPLRAP